MLKNSKNKNIFLLLIKISLLFFVFWLLINQLSKLAWIDFTQISVKNFGFLLLVSILLIVNLGLEFMKWRLILSTLHIETSTKTRIRSYLAGTVTGFITPNMLGNFIGRMFYFKRTERPYIILLTLYSNASQFIASLFFGFVALLLVGFHDTSFPVGITTLLVFSLLGIMFLFMLYFQLENVPFQGLQKKRWVKRLQEIFREHSTFRIHLLSLSFGRHFVFSIQYFLTLLAFGIEPHVELIFWIWQVYFWSTLLPSFWLGKLFIRESMALWVLGEITGEPAIVLVSSVSLWFINQSLPALVGIPFIQSSKQYSK